MFPDGVFVRSCRNSFVQSQNRPTDLDAPAAHDRDLFRTLTEVRRQNIEAYSGAGFDDTIYELGTALNEALIDPASWQRWRNHAQAFLQASVTPAG